MTAEPTPSARRTRRMFVDGDYGQIHLRLASPEKPSEPPLVLLHMFPQSGRNFTALIEAVSRRRLVIAPDFPGHGESDPPPAPISASDYARSIWQVVDQLQMLQQTGFVDLFGIHAGAKLAAEVTWQRPEHVGRLVLSSAAALAPSEVHKIRGAMRPVALDHEGRRFARLWAMLQQNRGEGTDLEMLAQSFAEMIRWGSRNSWGSQAVFDYNERFSDVISRLTHPITLLNPGDDLYELTPRTLPLLRNGTFVDRPNWGHGFLQSCAGELADFIEQALATAYDGQERGTVQSSR
ncbi:MAG: alpha/beta fold hydrolase [Pseudomonadota bacterium]